MSAYELYTICTRCQQHDAWQTIDNLVRILCTDQELSHKGPCTAQHFELAGEQ